MERDAFKKLFEPYLVSMRMSFDAPTWNAYYRVLKDVPVLLLSKTVDTLMAEPHEFIRKAGQIKALCEQARQALIAAHPFSACCDCEHSPGWREVKRGGYNFVERCPCWSRHWLKLEDMGVPARPLMLPPAEERTEATT